MSDTRKISLCIPTYNRFELLIESFVDVLSDDRVEEIIISDDHSDEELFNKLASFVSGISKIKLFRNEENQDCYKNKKTALTYAKNRNCVLFDSDNALTSEYVDKIFDVLNWDDYAAMLPAFAMPYFDYRKYEALIITKENANHNASDPTFTTMLNTANCFVDKDFYLKVWDSSINPHTADSIYMNYRMLSAGGKLLVVPGLHYTHRIDDHRGEQAGHYQLNVHKTPEGFHDSIVKKLKDMR